MLCSMHCGNQAVYFLTFRDLVPYEKETKSNINLYKGLVSLNPVCHRTEVLEAMQAQKEGRIKNGNVHTCIPVYVSMYISKVVQLGTKMYPKLKQLMIDNLSLE